MAIVQAYNEKVTNRRTEKGYVWNFIQNKVPEYDKYTQLKQFVTSSHKTIVRIDNACYKLTKTRKFWASLAVGVSSRYIRKPQSAFHDADTIVSCAYRSITLTVGLLQKLVDILSHRSTYTGLALFGSVAVVYHLSQIWKQ